LTSAEWTDRWQRLQGKAADLNRKTGPFLPAHARAYYDLGNVLRAQKRQSEAITAFEQAIAFDPQYVFAHNSLGLTLRDQKKLPEAISAFEKAIAIDPAYAVAYNNIGVSLRDQNKLPEAIAFYKKAIGADSKYALAYSNLGRALHDLNKFSEAVDAFDMAFELGTNNAAVHNTFAWLLATCPEPKLRDSRRAVEHAEKAVQLAPKQGNYWNTLGAARYRNGEWKEALAALEKSMELGQGGDPHDWFFMAMSQWQIGQQDEARKWHDRAVQWMEKNQSDNEELQRFRSESAALLGAG
jgi:tetratricopeptide (TPR) repeat protein